MKLTIIVALGGVSSFTLRTDFNIDGTGQSRVLKETDCFYTPDQADCTENLCPGGLVSHFAGSDIGILLPNNAKPVDFCDNFYAEWYGALTELHFFCKVENNQGAVRGIKGKYGPKPGQDTHQWGPTHGNDESGSGVHMEEWNLVDYTLFSIEIDYTLHEVLHFVGITTTEGFTGRCGRAPSNKAKVKSLVIPFQPGCSIRHISGSYVEAQIGEFNPGLYGLSFIITC